MLILLLILIALVLAALIFLFNRLVRSKNLVKEGWSGIDVQLRRRYNLIPNLVETVKGYAKHEKGVLEEVVKLRSQCIDAKKMGEQAQAENALTQALKGLFALAEAYPDLKANQNFLDLQKHLTEIEDQIQLARRYYNGTVRNFNIQIESFPSNLVAQIFNFKQAEFFEIEVATQREVPQVDFSPGEPSS
jgi:LemA protein